MNGLHKTVILAWAVIGLFFVGSKAFAAKAALFTDHAPLSIELRADLGKLCWKSGRRSCKEGRQPARLVFTDPDGIRQVVNVSIETRGRWRKKRDPCYLPLLFVEVSPSVAEGTVLEGQGLLPLTTPCRSSRGRWQQYLLREYLAYRIYNLLTDKSVRVRLVKIIYRNPSRPGVRDNFYAFFSENFLSVADRNRAKLEFLSSFDIENTDPTEQAIFDLFQFMIGNTDWSAVIPHNTVFLFSEDGSAAALPYDFDFSGIVNAGYATPPEILPLRSVRQRLFRGFCREDIDWVQVFGKFLASRETVFQMLEELPGMNHRSRKVTRRYLESFYDILQSPNKRQELIIDACR